MPIFQDDLSVDNGSPPLEPTIPSEPNSPENDETRLRRKVSEESIRTDLCEGPVPESFEEKNLPTREMDSSFRFPIHGTSDRAELIERLKRGENPNWLPNRNVSRDRESLFGLFCSL
jgi:hypothetical protein